MKLRHSYVIKLAEIVKDASGKVTLLKCTHDAATRDCMPSDRKVKGVIHWVDAQNFVPIEIRNINNLFLPFPTDGSDYEMMDYLNPHSLERLTSAAGEQSLSELFPVSGDKTFADEAPTKRFQFERRGFYALDRDSSKQTLVFNRTVGLKENTTVKVMEGTNTASRKEEQARQAALKDRLKKVEPSKLFQMFDLFKEFDLYSDAKMEALNPDLYSKYDDKGIPTHYKDGEELKKSAKKKLEKEYQKQEKLYATWVKESGA